jgi:hypothetical protein
VPKHGSAKSHPRLRVVFLSGVKKTFNFSECQTGQRELLAVVSKLGNWPPRQIRAIQSPMAVEKIRLSPEGISAPSTSLLIRTSYRCIIPTRRNKRRSQTDLADTGP